MGRVSSGRMAAGAVMIATPFFFIFFFCLGVFALFSDESQCVSVTVGWVFLLWLAKCCVSSRCVSINCCFTVRRASYFVSRCQRL